MKRSELKSYTVPGWEDEIYLKKDVDNYLDEISTQPIKCHYQILYVDEKNVQYAVFNSTNLACLSLIYSRMAAAESAIKSFPNPKCRLIISQDFNYDKDLGVWTMSSILKAKIWDSIMNTIIRTYGGHGNHFGNLP